MLFSLIYLTSKRMRVYFFYLYRNSMKCIFYYKRMDCSGEPELGAILFIYFWSRKCSHIKYPLGGKT